MYNISDSDEDNSSSDDEGQSTSSASGKAKYASKLHDHPHQKKNNKKHSDDSDQSYSEDADEFDDGDEYDKENKVIRRCNSPPPPQKQKHLLPPRGSITKLVLNKQLLSNKKLISQLIPPDNTATNLLPQFSRSSVGGSKYLLSCHPNPQPDIEDLVFESRFESGNLAKAVKITSGYYELYLRPDMYTNRHTQWFYFRVSNTRKNVNYR